MVMTRRVEIGNGLCVAEDHNGYWLHIEGRKGSGCVWLNEPCNEPFVEALVGWAKEILGDEDDG